MANLCAICKNEVIEEDEILTINTEYGDLINMLHKKCYVHAIINR